MNSLKLEIRENYLFLNFFNMEKYFTVFDDKEMISALNLNFDNSFQNSKSSYNKRDIVMPNLTNYNNNNFGWFNNSDKYDYFYNSYIGLVIRGRNGE